MNPARGLLVVADGMGGHAAGDVASRIAADTIEAAVAGEGEALDEGLSRAHEAVVAAAADGRGAPGMGTTAVVCRPGAAGLALAWVGDSRIYRCREGRLEALTRDHSLVNELIDAGELRAEEAQIHPERHVLARCIGAQELAAGDIDTATVATVPGDRILLCSDGLTGELGETRIAGTLALHPDDQEAADELVREAVAAGGRDNVSVIVATIA